MCRELFFFSKLLRFQHTFMSSLIEYVFSWVPFSRANARYHTRQAFLKLEALSVRATLCQLSLHHAGVSRQFCSIVESFLSDDDNNGFDDRTAALLDIHNKKMQTSIRDAHWILTLQSADNECRRRLSEAFELQTSVSTLVAALAAVQQRFNTTMYLSHEIVLQSIADNILLLASEPLKLALVEFSVRLKREICSSQDFDPAHVPLVDALAQRVVNVSDNHTNNCTSSEASVQARDKFFRCFLNAARNPLKVRAGNGIDEELATCRFVCSAFEQIADRAAVLSLRELCGALTAAQQKRSVRLERERLERQRREEAERREAERQRLIYEALDEFVQDVESTIRYWYGPTVWCSVEKVVSKCAQRPKAPDIPRSWKLIDIVKARAKKSLSISPDDNFISVNHLTPCRVADERRFGSFRCVKCGKTWCSANSWADSWQSCRQCNVKVYPYRQDELQRPDDDDYDRTDKEPHPMELCQKCQQLGSSCVRRGRQYR